MARLFTIEPLWWSYGIKAAQVYLRQHPNRVRAIAMDGVVPLNTSMWSDTPRLAQEALDRVFDLCSRQEHCRHEFPNLKQEFGSLLERLSEKPAKVKAEPPNSRQPMEITLYDQSVREFVYGQVTSAISIRTLPLMLHLAYQENYQLWYNGLFLEAAAFQEAFSSSLPAARRFL